MSAKDLPTAEGAGPMRFPWETPPETAAVIEVAEGIFWVRAPLPMRLDHVNCYVLDEGTHWTVVDTGIHTAETVAAWEALLSGPFAGKPVGRLVLTHHHPDHVGLLGWFAARGAEVWMTRYGFAMARMHQMDRPDVQPPENVRMRRRGGQPEAEVAKYASEPPWHFPVLPIPMGFRVIEEGATLSMGGRDWKVHFGHGHAMNHATFWTDEIVLAGDQIIPGISSNVGVYAIEPEGNPLGAWLESCERLRDVAEGIDPLILPGHKTPFHGASFRLTQLIENHEHALDRILEALESGPRSAAEVFLPIFKREITGSQYGLALAEAFAHMNLLRRKGQVRRDLEGEVWRYSLGREEM